MRKQNSFKLLLCILLMCIGVNVWGKSVTKTYTFNSKLWGAKDEAATTANWTGSSDGNQFSATNSPIGVQVTASLSGLTVTSPTSYTNVTNVVVTYSSSSKGVGSIAVAVGSTTIDTKSISKSQSKVDLTYTPSEALSGSVVITANCTNNSLAIYKVAVTYSTGGGSTVTAPAFDVAAGTYTEDKTVSISNYNSNYLYAYTTDGTAPAFDDELNITNGTAYDNNNGITITSSCTLKAIAVDEDGNASSVTSAAYVINKPVEYASLEELVAADITSGTTVKVTFSNVAIKSFYTTSAGYTNGVYFDIQKGGNDIEIYYQNVPSEWVAGGTLSGTMTCPWTLYNGTWELAPARDTWAWSNLTYTAPATRELQSIVVSGTPTKTTYEAGDALNPAGLVVTGTYSAAPTEEVITEGITWTLNPETLSAGATTCDVMASVGSVMSAVYTVTGLTVTAPKTLSSVTLSGTPTKTVYTVGENFDPSGITVTANYSDATTANVTSEATFYGVSEALTAGQTSFETYATYKTVDSDVKAYTITVNKKTASIAINNMEISKNASNVAIVATTTPENATLTYSIVSGSDYVTLADGKVSAVAPGTATIKASYAGNDEYATAETTFTVTVSNLMIATKDGFTTGDNSGSHNFTSNTDISFEAFKGGANTDPAIPNETSYLRLYQNGGYVAITGVKGVKIQSVILTTGSTYASTTVGYCVDNGDAPTTGETVAKSSSYTISGLNNQEVEIYCLGTDKNTRLDIASLKVGYTKEAVTLTSIAVSGEYQTSFIKNAEFNHTGAVVTATFSDGDTQNVTTSAVFSEPDMTTTGTKIVTVSYTREGVEKTTSYEITVNEEIVTSIALSGNYTKVFKTSDTFSHDGVVVTATYNSARTADVTADAEFSTPDLTTTGTKTVTVTYAEKSATYDIKVIPATAIFFESFDTNEGTGGNDKNWSGAIASNDLTSDNKGWTFAKGNGAKECAKFGTGSVAGSAQTPAITLTGDAKITFKAAAWNGNSEVLGLTLSATSGTLSQTSVEMTKAAWTEYTVYLYGVETSTQITFAASQSSNNRFFLDEVLVETVPSSVDITISDAKYSTYYNSTTAYTMPDDCEGYIFTATGGLVRVYGDGEVVPAGEPLVIYSETAGTKTLTFTTSSEETYKQNDMNDLEGTDEETELTADDNSYFYGLSLNAEGDLSSVGFYWMAAEGAAFTNGAHKAYLKLAKRDEVPARFLFNPTPDSPIVTGLEAVAGEGKAVKFLKDGQLFILKNGKVFNAAGQVVK